MRARARTFPLLLVAVALIVAGCGGGSTSTSSDGGSLSLTHVDGTLALEGDTVTVTPIDAGEAVELQIGPAVERGTAQALGASGAKARVYFREGDDPIAAKIEEAPSVTEGTTTYDGLVVKVSAGMITIDGDDGSKTYMIREADRAAFDIDHLEEHRAESEAVRIYVQQDDNGGEFAVAYEDA